MLADHHLDQLGLGPAFEALPHRKESRVELAFDDGSIVENFSRLPGRYRHLALVPQWDFLSMLATAGAASPHFDLRMSAELTDVTRTSARYLDRTTGTTHDLATSLVIGCDGRHSRLRDALALPRKEVATSFDALYLNLPREAGDPEHTIVRFSGLGGIVMLNRVSYWQVAVLIGKGSTKQMLADDAAATRAAVTALDPSLADRVAAMRADEIARLEVRIDRLLRWWAPGALCIGDAAHAMSPVAGVGINLAIQDAVAAARILVPALRAGRVTDRHLAAVQRRRTLPTLLTQAMQRAAQARFTTVPADGLISDLPPLRIPQPLRTLRHLPVFEHLLGRVVGIGIRPERLTGSLAPLAVTS